MVISDLQVPVPFRISLPTAVLVQEPAWSLLHSFHRLHARNLARLQASAPPTARFKVSPLCPTYPYIQC